MGMLLSEIPSGMCAKLRTMAASSNRDHPTRSLYYCFFAPHTYIFVLRAHPVRGESFNQRNTTGEAATGTWFPPHYHPGHVTSPICKDDWLEFKNLWLGFETGAYGQGVGSTLS